jgi:dynein heavy chain
MIDPQKQANGYIRNMGREHHDEGIELLKMTNRDFIKSLEACIQHGKWALIENVGHELDPSLEPVLLQQTVKTSGGLVLTLGDKQLMYNSHFKFFMTTTLPNPHYPPEIFVKVTIINFAITEQGLEDQMLAELVALENPQLEQKKKEIVRRNAEDKKLL